MRSLIATYNYLFICLFVYLFNLPNWINRSINKQLNKSSIAALLLVLPFILSAQINTIKFEHFSSNEGLSYNVKCIQQDTLGFLWVGTLNGLNRYDGMQFIQYFHDPQDSTSLSHNNITKLYEDRKGNLWIGTEEGLNLFNRKTNQFRRFSFQTGKGISATQDYIQDILEDIQGHLWIATKKGLILFNEDYSNFEQFYKTKNGVRQGNIAGNHVRCLYEDEERRLWVGFLGFNGLQYFDREKQEFVSVLYNPDELEQLLKISITDIFEDSKGQFWLGSRDHFRLFKKTLRSVVSILIPYGILKKMIMAICC